MCSLDEPGMIVEVEALEEALEFGVWGDRLDQDIISLDDRDAHGLGRRVGRGEVWMILK